VLEKQAVGSSSMVVEISQSILTKVGS
jgi:hypothetical protein